MHAHYTIRHRPLFGALEQLLSHPGSLSLRLGTAGARLAASSQALPASLREEAAALTTRIDEGLRRPGGLRQTEAVGLARQMVDLYDRHATAEEQGREMLFRRAWQRLYAAVLILCSEPGTIQERLANVYLSAFVHWTAAEIPPSCEREFLALKDELAQIVQFRGLGVERARFLAHAVLLLYAQALGIEYERGAGRSSRRLCESADLAPAGYAGDGRTERPTVNRAG